MIVDQGPIVNQRHTPSPLADRPDVAISVRNVGKMYRIYERPQDRLKQMLFRGRRMYGREFWAIRNVSFTVNKGEMVGVIGRNGSGKSTLLQIIAGTLTPTEGEVRVEGRVAALLELGSGFNPEFTGRENVFLNGSILGLNYEEMRRRFDAIIAFADIGDFIDQPVKTYSSGMFVRLAFAVQASIDPDILIVDEALAVGDVFFRQKCYRRLEALREQGTSILLVSHSMADVEQFCRRAIFLEHSEAIFEGSSSEAIRRYYLSEQQEARVQVAGSPIPRPLPQITATPAEDANGFLWPSPDAFLDISTVTQISNGWATCTGVALCNSQCQPQHVFQQGETASFFYEFELLHDIQVPFGGLQIHNDRGLNVHGKNALHYDYDMPTQVARGSRIRFRQDVTLNIVVGEYTFEIGIAAMIRHDYEHRATYSPQDLNARSVRLCHLMLGPLIVAYRASGKPTRLLFDGVADLPGDCQVNVIAANNKYEGN